MELTDKAMRAFFIATLAVCLAGASHAAMRDEPREFLGTPFGAPYVPDTSFSCQSDSEEGLRCSRAKDSLSLEGVPLTSVSYLFMYKQLYTVDLEVSGRENFDRLESALTAKHGRPIKTPSGMTVFEGVQVDIILYYDKERSAGEVSYVFKNLPCPVE